jgi:hypothetical protein
MLFHIVNSVACCEATRTTSTVTCMGKMERKPLDQHQKDDARRLRSLWDKLHGEVSQAAFAADNGIGQTQGSVEQYLNGRIPLNLSVAIKFASGLRCRVADFSPTMGKELEKVYDDPRAARLADMFCSFTEEEKNAVYMDAAAKTAGNRALRKETGPALKPARNERVESALKAKAPKLEGEKK